MKLSLEQVQLHHTFGVFLYSRLSACEKAAAPEIGLEMWAQRLNLDACLMERCVFTTA